MICPVNLHAAIFNTSIQLSWTKALKNRFKNMRRVPRSARTGLDFTPPDTNRKKKNALHQNWSQSTSGQVLDELTYQRHKTALVRDHERKKTSTESTLIMMRETAANRRQWIQEERPTVTVIIKEFPYLKDPPVVSF